MDRHWVWQNACAIFPAMATDEVEREEITDDIPVISEEDMPALFRAADQSSIAAQRRYLFVLFCNLFFLTGGAVLTSVLPVMLVDRSGLAFAGSVSFAIGLFFTLVISQFGFEKAWYGGRAIAESVKTISWRYMTRAEPYDESCDNCDASLIRELRSIMLEREEMSRFLGGRAGSDEQITQKMRDARSMDTANRKRLYIRQRIAHQRDWYSTKAAINERGGRIWFAAIVFAQLFALIFAFYIVYVPTTELNLTGPFSTLAGALLAWLQAKRHQEQAQAYSLAAHELGLISALAEGVTTDDELSQFVAESESAISREHTMWSARRNNFQK